MEKEIRFVKGENEKENHSHGLHVKLPAGLMTLAMLATLSPWNKARAEKPDYTPSHPIRQGGRLQPTTKEPQPTLVIPQKEQKAAFDPLNKEEMLATFMPRYRTMSEEQKQKVKGALPNLGGKENLLCYFPKTDAPYVRQEKMWNYMDYMNSKHFMVAYGDKMFIWPIASAQKRDFISKCIYLKNNQPIMVLRLNEGYNPNFPITDQDNKICINAPLLKHQVAWDDIYGLILIDEDDSIVGQYDLADGNIQDIREDMKKANLDQYDKEPLRLTPEGNAYLDPNDTEYNQRLRLRMEKSYFDRYDTSFYIRPRQLKKPIPLSQLRIYDTQTPTDLIPLEKREIVTITNDEIEDVSNINTETKSYQRVKKNILSLVNKGAINEIDAKQYIETGNETGIHSFTILKNAHNEPSLVLIQEGIYGLERNQAQAVKEAIDSINLIDPDLINYLVKEYHMTGIGGNELFNELNVSSDSYYNLCAFDAKTGLLAISDKKKNWPRIEIILPFVGEPYKETKEGREHINVVEWLKKNEKTIDKSFNLVGESYWLILQSAEKQQQLYFNNQSN